MWGFAEVSGFFSTVLRVYGPILRHAFEDPGISKMRDRIAAKKKKVADEATKKTSTKVREGPKDDDES